MEDDKNAITIDYKKASEMVRSHFQVGFVGKKIGMTQVYNQAGDALPVTVVQIVPGVVTHSIQRAQAGVASTSNVKRVKVGFAPKAIQRCSKSEKGMFKGSGHPGYQMLKEFDLPAETLVEVGAAYPLFSLEEGVRVDIQGISKGKGFQGVMKRHGFAGGPASHGASVCHRSPGSIGNRADPGRVFPGKKMAGHMGNRVVTTLGLQVVKFDAEKGCLFIKGAIPGSKNSFVVVGPAVKAG